ncbi:MAG: magnetosome biogenesis CDF transporter MamM [Magnetococcales bacterium]|nr:magnetosome biogenesis CDF transporter MamM [Magnetococcales bacterium]
MKFSRCVTCHQIVGWVGLVVNLGLSGLKLFVGLVAGSQALVVDALYSAKDVITSLLIIIGLKYSKQPIDREHPFGHGKVEFVLSAVVSLLLMVVTGLLFFYAAEHLLEGEHRPPHLVALWTAIFSMAVNWVMHRYTRCVAAEINSPMVGVLAKHHHSDATASLSVAVGIVGSHYLGMPWLDTVVAVGETLDLLYLGGAIFWDAFQGLMDTSASREVEALIHRTTLKVPGVQQVEQLRTRRVGQEVWIDMVIGVQPDQPVGEAHKVVVRVERALVDIIPHVGDVSVHFQSLTGSVPELHRMRDEIARLGVSTPAEEG